MSLLRHRSLIGGFAIPVLGAGATGNFDTDSSYTITPLSAPSLGDHLIALIGGSQARAVTGVPAGWNEVVLAPGNGTNYIYWKTATASEPASYTFTLSGALTGGWGYMPWTGIDPNSPVLINLGNSAAGVLTISPVTTYNAVMPGIAISTLNMDSTGTWTPDNGFSNPGAAGQFKLARKVHSVPADGLDLNWSTASGIPRTVNTRLVYFKAKAI